jgi:hypothetical protein
MRRFWSIKDAKVNLGAVDLNLRRPFVYGRAKIDAEKAGFVGALGFPMVFVVHATRNIAQVAKPVVGWNAIQMVDVVCRPRARHVKPSKAVGLLDAAKNTDAYVSGTLRASCDVANLDLVAGNGSAREKAGLWIVVKQLTKALRRQFSHSKPHQGIPRVLARVGMSHRFACLLGQRAHSI